jgi:hypothetical protein
MAQRLLEPSLAARAFTLRRHLPRRLIGASQEG